MRVIKQSDIQQQLTVWDLQKKIDKLIESITSVNFETVYREISILKMKHDRLAKYKDHTLARQIDYNIKVTV